MAPPAIIAHNSISAHRVVDHAATTRDPAGFGGMIASEAALAAVMRIVGISAAVQEVLDPAAMMRAGAIQPDAAICVVVSAAVGAVGPMAEARSVTMVCAEVSAAVVVEAVPAEARRAAMPHIAGARPARIAKTGRSSTAIDATKATRAHLAQVRLVIAHENRAAHAHLVIAHGGRVVHVPSVIAHKDREVRARLRIVHEAQASAHPLSAVTATGVLTHGHRNHDETTMVDANLTGHSTTDLLVGHSAIGLLASRPVPGATRPPKALVARAAGPPPEATPARPEARRHAGVASVGNRPVHRAAVRLAVDPGLPGAPASASGATTKPNARAMLGRFPCGLLCRRHCLSFAGKWRRLTGRRGGQRGQGKSSLIQWGFGRKHSRGRGWEFAREYSWLGGR